MDLGNQLTKLDFFEREPRQKIWNSILCISFAVQLRDLLKSRVECPDFLQKLEKAQASVPQNLAGMFSESWELYDFWNLFSFLLKWNYGSNNYMLIVLQKKEVHGTWSMKMTFGKVEIPS